MYKAKKTCLMYACNFNLSFFGCTASLLAPWLQGYKTRRRRKKENYLFFFGIREEARPKTRELWRNNRNTNLGKHTHPGQTVFRLAGNSFSWSSFYRTRILLLAFCIYLNKYAHSHVNDFWKAHISTSEIRRLVLNISRNITYLRFFGSNSG